MPRGEYALLDGAGERVGGETFTAAPGPMGWRYYATAHGPGASTRIDLSVDARGRPVRVRLETGDHELLVAARAGTLHAFRDGEQVELPVADGFLHPSPGFAAVALHAAPPPGEHAVVAIDPGTLTLRAARTRLERGDEEPVHTAAGVFEARRWTIDGRAVWIAGTVAVAGDLFRLVAYEAGATGPAPRLRGL